MSAMPANLRALAAAIRTTAAAGHSIGPQHAFELAATLEAVATTMQDDEKTIALQEQHARDLEDLLAACSTKPHPMTSAVAA